MGLPRLAGHALRDPRTGGRERCAAEARSQRHRQRARPPGPLRRSRFPRTPRDRSRARRHRRTSRATASLIEDDRVAAVTLTGSNRAGAAVGAAAGRAAKKSVLELGGSDAFVVLDDADVEAAAAAAVKARFTNSGQSCVCAKRFIVTAAVAAELTAAFVAGVEALRVGDPRDRDTQVGPLARDDLRAAIQRQVEESVAAGARLLTGGNPLPGEGCFYQPTVLADTGPGMPAFDEETFGPLAALAVARDDEDAVRLANASSYGLGLSIWTADPGRGVALARRVTSGAAFVNAVVASDPRLPFGGTKRSGYGRELAAAGIREFTNTRSYWVTARPDSARTGALRDLSSAGAEQRQ
ncbi:aldehyde dehydrogenase family protein [Streptomyces muensis]|uniref:aldehyde dehydrogenase family protein n=1 Tax=Streptomyces muensis TaxID=1077944 RepID=UPI0027E2D6C6|nr:aldehyde dehydrogenase family protein [Streptomyces muensis]